MLPTETEDAIIYYSLDGSEPYQPTVRGSSSGTAYTGPIPISRTTVLKAIATKTGWMPTDVKTQTYIFVEDVIRQSLTCQAPCPGCPSCSFNCQYMKTCMD